MYNLTNTHLWSFLGYFLAKINWYLNVSNVSFNFNDYRLLMITHAACTSSQFRCDNGDCVSSSFRCNGRTGGCSDGSDERGCSKLTCY